MHSNNDRSAKFAVTIAGLALVAALVGLSNDSNRNDDRQAASSAANGTVDSPVEQTEADWISLFDGETLDGWELTNFGGEGEVTVDDGRLVLGMGGDMTGVHTHRALPQIEYEVEVDAMRVDGFDFFCGLTFPVREDHCSLIIGGWSGGVCGLSCLDWQDASENETTTYKLFDSGRWYHIRLRVGTDRIQAWIDEEEILDVDITDKKISVRGEVEPSKPFGFASWRTTAALRNIRVRELSEDPSNG